MRILLITALLLGTAVQAQEKGTPTTTTPAVATPSKEGSALLEQKREASGMLKSTMQTAEMLLSKVKGVASSAKPEDQGKFVKMVDDIKVLQGGLNDELVAVNRATEKDGPTVFARAKEVNTNSQKVLEGYSTQLGDSRPVHTKEPQQDKSLEGK